MRATFTASARTVNKVVWGRRVPTDDGPRLDCRPLDINLEKVRSKDIPEFQNQLEDEIKRLRTNALPSLDFLQTLALSIKEDPPERVEKIIETNTHLAREIDKIAQLVPAIIPLDPPKNGLEYAIDLRNAGSNYFTGIFLGIMTGTFTAIWRLANSAAAGFIALGCAAILLPSAILARRRSEEHQEGVYGVRDIHTPYIFVKRLCRLSTGNLRAFVNLIEMKKPEIELRVNQYQELLQELMRLIKQARLSLPGVIHVQSPRKSFLERLGAEERPRHPGDELPRSS